MNSLSSMERLFCVVEYTNEKKKLGRENWLWCIIPWAELNTMPFPVVAEVVLWPWKKQLLTLALAPEKGSHPTVFPDRPEFPVTTVTPYIVTPAPEKVQRLVLVLPIWRIQVLASWPQIVRPAVEEVIATLSTATVPTIWIFVMEAVMAAERLGEGEAE